MKKSPIGIKPHVGTTLHFTELKVGGRCEHRGEPCRLENKHYVVHYYIRTT